VDLAREKAAMNRTWAKREKQMETIVSSTAKFTGELQALCGPSLPQLPQFALPGNGWDAPISSKRKGSSWSKICS
jgi:hypothetical protein